MVEGGKGSEVIVQRRIAPDSNQGPQFTFKKHGDNPEIDWRVIRSMLRRFGIPESAVWKK